MRKYIKNRLFEILNSITHATDILKKLCDRRDEEHVPGLLEDMQQAAIEMGESIEEAEGEGTEAVRLLEDFCEKLYQISMAVPSDRSRLSKNLIRAIGDIRSAISNIEEQYIAVFLPYKASMWDSMATVYLAAAKDPSCTAYVMPIPYYDKNPDGSLRTEYYDGDQFPSYVPITGYNDRNLEEDHPDFIFIHNPYDENNYVTTVHPYFYSKNLRNMTDCLVYIPYFVHQNNQVKDIYALQPAVLWSHVVVLQSEEVCYQYRKYYKEAVKDTFTDYDKFKPWGSPKFDDAKALIKEQVEIPAEWKTLVGTGDKKRKVVFFNTHLSGLMKGKTEEFFEKLNRTFEIFRKRSDVVLLWRPHPLSYETAKAMNPQVADQYLKIVGAYKAEGFGIYDDSPDLHRAIDFSDAYYGSHSSVAELFRCAGKPVLYMYREEEEEE